MSFPGKSIILSPRKGIACLPSKVNIMPGRFSWKGYLRLSLVSIPVKSYPAVNACSSHGVSLNQLHEKCHSRIKYVKTCPIHGEVSPDEIVSGFEYEKGHYAVIEPSELDALRTEADHAVTVQSVVLASTVDPLYLGGKTMYLVPDGKVGQSAYAVLQKALADENLIGVAQVVLNGKENTVLLRPASKLIAMVSVNYSDEVTLPSEHDSEVTAEGSAAEVKMMKTLLGTIKEKRFQIGEYHDLYAERLQALVAAKVKGQKVVTAPHAEEPPPVINLMDALKQSLKHKDEKPKPARTRSTAMKSTARRTRKRA